MKGIVFTEFMELVQAKFGEETIDQLIEVSNLPSQAAYTTVGTYDHGEMLTLVRNLSRAVQVPMAELLKDYGMHLFGRFAVRYPQFFSGVTSSFEFLDRVEAHIHVDVKKLYPDAELPSIRVDWISKDRIHLIYSSRRPLAAFAEGMMRGAIAHFQETVAVKQIDASSDGTFVVFELTRS